MTEPDIQLELNQLKLVLIDFQQTQLQKYNELQEKYNKLQEKSNQLENRYIQFENENKELHNKCNQLEIKYEELVNKKNEIYYQKFLERKLLATHKKTTHGITDITTNNEHIEIKHWKNYKNALGQLLSYNHNDNKSLCAYFFGSVNDNQCEQIIELYRLKGVSIKQFIDTANGIIIKTVLDTNVTNKNEQNDFHSWLDENIEYKENSVLKLSECVEKFLNKIISPRELGKYREQLEKYIKNKYPQINFKYKQFWINNQSYKGWQNLALINKEDNFSNWLNKNIEYKENSILKLSNCVEMYLGKQLGPRSKTTYKKDIENFLKNKFPTLNNLYQDSKINDIKYKGWLHFALKS